MNKNNYKPIYYIVLIKKKFFNCLLNICVMNGLVDWSDKDPKKEFKQLGELLIVYMMASGIEVDK